MVKFSMTNWIISSKGKKSSKVQQYISAEQRRKARKTQRQAKKRGR